MDLYGYTGVCEEGCLSKDIRVTKPAYMINISQPWPKTKYKLYDLKKLKKMNALDLLKVKLLKYKLTKSKNINLLVSHGCVSTHQSKNDPISSIVSIDFYCLICII